MKLRRLSNSLCILALLPLLGLNSACLAQISEVNDKENNQKRKQIDKHLNSLVRHRRSRTGWLGDSKLPSNCKVFSDLPYVNNAGINQKLDIYIPTSDRIAKDQSPATKPPLVVWIHGGGWRGGDKKGGPIRALIDSGLAVASINYRLSSEAKWPAQLDDCKSALVWLANNAKDYGYDPTHIGLWGASAGGHLVLMLALKDGTANGVKSVCDWFGPTDLASYIQSKNTTPNGIEMIRQLLGVDDKALIEAAKAASPISYIKSTEKLPDILIVHGKQDPLVPVEQSQQLAAELAKIGVKNTTLSLIKGGHGYPGFGDASIQESISFLKDSLKGK